MKLSKCPFCGGEAGLSFAGMNYAYIDKNGVGRNLGFHYTVRCGDKLCGCRIGNYEDLEIAVEAWNRRAKSVLLDEEKHPEDQGMGESDENNSDSVWQNGI